MVVASVEASSVHSSSHGEPSFPLLLQALKRRANQALRSLRLEV